MWRRLGGMVGVCLAIGGACGAPTPPPTPEPEPVPEPAAPAPERRAHVAPGRVETRAIPIGDGPSAALPPPSASGREDLPPGAACRIGSARFTTSRSYDVPVLGMDGRLYLTSLGDWRVLDAGTGRELERFQLQEQGIVAALSPQGTCAANRTDGDDGATTLTAYRMPERTPVGATTRASDDPRDTLVADDCSVLVEQRGFDQPCVGVFGAGLAARADICLGAGVEEARLSADGTRLALVTNVWGSPEAGIHVFDVARGARIAHVAREGSEAFGEVALTRDGARIAYAVDDVVRVTALGPAGPAGTAGATVVLARPPGSHARALAFSPDGTKLALVLTGDAGDTLAMVDLARRKTTFMLVRLPAFDRVAFSPDGARAAISAGGAVRIVDTSTGRDLVGHGRLYDIESAALDASGERAVISAREHLSVWDADDCTLLANLPNVPRLSGLTLMPDAKSAFAFADATYVRVDLERDGARAEVALGPGVDEVPSRELSPDGKWLVLGAEVGDEQQVLIVDTSSNVVVRRASLGRLGPIGALLFTPDGASVHAVAPGGLAHGDLPTGATSVVEVDVASGAVRSRFTIPSAWQTYDGAVLEGGRIIQVNDQSFARATGEPLPVLAWKWKLLASSSDHVRALWGDGRRAFVWESDAPRPARPRALFELGYGPALVGRRSVMRCDAVSCVVWRIAK